MACLYLFVFVEGKFGHERDETKKNNFCTFKCVIFSIAVPFRPSLIEFIKFRSPINSLSSDELKVEVDGEMKALNHDRILLISPKAASKRLFARLRGPIENRDEKICACKGEACRGNEKLMEGLPVESPKIQILV